MKYQAYVLLFVFFSATIAYHELYRPGYHFSAPKNWMNDPVGLVYFHGLYHMYYQYNPYANIWGNMSWGHAVSTDLVYWENLPVAMYPYDNVFIFSGSNIVDVNNTSGFCSVPQVGCLIAFYTSHVDVPAFHESQSMAYSNDFGVTYTQYAHNPIINESYTDAHRDPKVFWYAPESKWIMITAFPTPFMLKLYTSKDLKNWTHLSDFGPMGSTSGGWEDPDLFELSVDGDPTKKKWVISHAVSVNQVEYYIGDFDGTTFTESDNTTLFIDYGRDFDEAATFNNEPNGRRLMMAWLDEGQYGGELPERDWRGQLTLVRELTLKTFPEGIRIVQQPPDSMSKLRTSPAHSENFVVSPSAQNYTLNVTGTQLEVIVVFNMTDNNTKEFGINFFQGKDQITTVGYQPANQSLFTNRINSGAVDFDPTFAGISATKLDAMDGNIIKLRLFIDSCSVEVFANDGKIAMSNLIFPDPTQDKLSLYSVGGNVTVTSLDSWTLKGIWPGAVEETKEKIEEFLSLYKKEQI